MNLVDSFLVLCKWKPPKAAESPKKPRVIKKHIKMDNVEQLTIEKNTKTQRKTPENPHKSPDAQALTALIQTQSRTKGGKGSHRRNNRTEPQKKHLRQLAESKKQNQQETTIGKHIFSAPRSDVNIRSKDEQLSTHAFKPRKYQLALEEAKQPTQPKIPVSKQIQQEKDRNAVLDLLIGIEEDDLDDAMEDTTYESDTDILARRMNELHILREMSRIFVLDQKLERDSRARQLCHETCIPEFLEELLTEIVEEEVKEQMPEAIYRQCLRELADEWVFDQKEFFDLTPKDVQNAGIILNRTKNGSEIVSTGYNVEMTRELLLCLRTGQWLNDEVINFYLSLCGTRSEEGHVGLTPLPKVHFFSTFFYTKLMQCNKYAHANVKRWTRKIDLFAMDKIIIPIHLGVHWTCAVINIRDKQFEYYDSMNGSARGKQVLKDLRRYIEDESVDKKATKLDTEHWPFIIPDSDSLPQQENSNDCGVFTCKFANFISQDKEITFSQRHMEYFRNRMALEIAQKRVL